MGDSLITIILHNLPHQSSSPSLLSTIKYTHKLSGDSTLRDLIDHIHSTVTTYNNNNETTKNNNLSFFDCSYHPPREIIIDETNNEYTGPNSKTLQSMGWFPSGKIVVTRRDDEDSRRDILTATLREDMILDDDDDTDDDEATTARCRQRVILTQHVTVDDDNNCNTNASSQQPPLPPSQIFHNISTRFDHPPNNVDNTNAPPKQQRRRRTEAERCQKLDAAIAAIDHSLKKKRPSSSSAKKQSKINDKVRQMLIKSRATGSKTLREEDRMYLAVGVVRDDVAGDGGGGDDKQPPTTEGDVSYRFFSRLTTVGRVAEDIVAKTTTTLAGSLGVEFLVGYRRVPNTMRLWELETKGILKSFDRVLVRIYDEERDDASPGVFDDLMTSSKEEEDGIIETRTTATLQVPDDGNDKPDTSSTKINDNNYMTIATRIEKALRQHDEKESTSEKKTSSRRKTTTTTAKRKPSSTSLKVKQMLMKRHANGDNRIPIDDRVYLELIFVRDDDVGLSCSEKDDVTINTDSSVIFVSRRGVTTVGRFIEMMRESSGDDGFCYECLLLVPPTTEKGAVGELTSYSIDGFVESSTSVERLVDKGFLRSFDRVVIRRWRKHGDGSGGFRRVII